MTITRFVSVCLDQSVLESSDLLEQMFIQDCKALGLYVRVHDKTLATNLYSRETVLAAMDTLRDAGHKVYLTNGLFYPDKFALVLEK